MRFDRESDLQSVATKLLDGMRLLWCHPPNGAYLGGSNRARAGARLKAQGMKPGVPDIVIFSPAPINGAISFIELKTASGRLSHNQKIWKDQLEELGYNWALCRSIDDILSALSDWGYEVIPQRNSLLRPREISYKV